MTKAKKGLIITLFAAVMVFAFGATSAFAANLADVEWNSDFSQVKVEGATGEYEVLNGTYDQIKKTWSDEEHYRNGHGLVFAHIDFGQYQKFSGYGSEALADFNNIVTYHGGGFYFDLNNSEIKGGSIWTRDEFERQLSNEDGVLSSDGMGLSMKDGVTTPAGPSYDFPTSPGFPYTVTYKYSGFDPDNLGAQTVTLNAIVKVNGEEEQVDYLAKHLIGAVPAKVITVGAKEQTWRDIKIDVDKTDKYSDTLNDSDIDQYVGYDGKLHELVTSTVEGWTVSYALQDETTGAYKDVLSVQAKDAGEYNFKVTATPSDTTKEAVTKYGKLTVEPKYSEYNYYWNPELSDVENTVPTGTVARDYVSALICQYTNVPIYEADQEEAMAVFDALYDVEVKASSLDPSKEKWAMVMKEDADVTAVYKAHKTLFDNYNMNEEDLYDAHQRSVTVNRVDFKADEVLFTEAPDMTYHVKKAKKLKKTKSFTVEATAASGKAVTYKVDSPSKKITIDAETGKVTVKKGLKKGTYKVRVMAVTSEGAGYAVDGAWRVITIKIKK